MIRRGDHGLCPLLLAGVAFGYAAPGRWKWLPVVFPLVLAIGAALIHGIGAALIIRLSSPSS